jgi:putative ABC transport system permease protein
MGTLWQDIRYGFRMLIRNRGVTVFAMLALGIGISANSTIFSMVNSVLLSPWPFPNPERIMRIGEKRKGSETGNPSLSGPNYLEWGDKCQSFEATCLVTMRFLNLTGGDSNPEEVAAYVWAPSGANVFLGSFEPGLGRFFLPDEDQPGKEHVAILSHGLWRDRYGADPAILGKSIQLDGEPYTVIGVLPASTSVFEAEAKLWLPLPIEDVKKANRSERNYVAFGLLKPGVSVQQARAEMEVIAQNLAREYEENENQEIIVEPMIQNLLRAVKQTMIVMHGAVAFVLLIACSNVASLLLGRATTRQKEMSIRTALGASRMRVVRQMLTESILLSLVGGLLGLLFTVWGIELLKTLLPPVLMEFVTRQGIDVRLLAFTLIISVATGLLFGLVPALRASKFNLNETLKEGGRGSGSRSSSHLMLRFLVVSEIALSLVLLVGAGLMINSFVRLQSVDPGFKSENLMTLHVTLRGSKYDEKHEKRAFYREIVPRIEGIPGELGGWSPFRGGWTVGTARWGALFGPGSKHSSRLFSGVGDPSAEGSLLGRRRRSRRGPSNHRQRRIRTRNVAGPRPHRQVIDHPRMGFHSLRSRRRVR